MKKLSILFLMAFVSFAGTVSAQEEEETTTTGGVEQFTNKNGFAVLPEAGSFAIGFDALPFLRFAGNMFNGNTNNNFPNAGYANQGGASLGGTLYGKYFLSETTAIRGRFSINQSTVQDVNRVMLDGQAVPQANIEVEDELIMNNFGFNLGGGMEFRRGKGRLMGVYGGEAMIGLNTSNEKYTYGNAITAGNQTPTTTTNFAAGNSGQVGSRVLSRTFANSFSVAAMGFAGVEYFFAPQISIGAEFTLGLRYTGTNRSEVVREEWEANSNTLINVSDVDANILTNFGVATGVWGGSINLMFHF
jgi:hypothetical protein